MTQPTEPVSLLQPPVPTRMDYLAWGAMAFGLLLVLELHLLPALLAGLLTFEVIDSLAGRLTRGLTRNRAKLLVIGLVAIGVLLVVAALAIGAAYALRDSVDNMSQLMRQLAEILERSRQLLPPAVVDWLPADESSLKHWAVGWLREHSGKFQLAGQGVALGLVYVFFGLVIGALVAWREPGRQSTNGPLAAVLYLRLTRLRTAFRNVVFAQVRIAGINAFLTGLYLAGMLPLLGIHLPFTKTLILLTFVVGLLPVLGNLISNTVIVMVSLTYSPLLAIGSLSFLVVIHKLEYFLNARIVGARIAASAWELLVAMLAMEAAFGIPGLVAAPVFYAYLKDELRAWRLI